jgi:thiamine kinase-like enzyme
MQLANDNCCELFDADAVLSKLSAQESHAEEGINQLISFALQSLPKLFEVLSEKASPDQLRATVTQKLKDLLHKAPAIRQKTKELVHLCKLSREPSTAEQKDLLHRYCSFLHGDFHAGNIAFRKRAVVHAVAAGESQSPSQYDICPVDWQSYGLGDPVAELVYHIFGVVSASDVLNEFATRGVRIDETLLEFYHARRSAERQSAYPLSELKERYDLLARNATLLLIADAYRWYERARKQGDGVTPSKLRHEGFMSLEESEPTSTFLNAWMDSTAARALSYFICEPL